MAKRRKAKVKLGSSSAEHTTELKSALKQANTALKNADKSETCDRAVDHLLNATYIWGQAQAHYLSGVRPSKGISAFAKRLTVIEKRILGSCLR